MQIRGRMVRQEVAEALGRFRSDDLIGRFLATRQPMNAIDAIPLFGNTPGHGPAPQVIRYLTFWVARLE